jgi:hypothetical protein
MHTHTQIYHAQEEVEILMYPPPKPELGKVWHCVSRNQGVVGEHDEQYQMLVGT